VIKDEIKSQARISKIKDFSPYENEATFSFIGPEKYKHNFISIEMERQK